jgi:ClpP class serine protease
MNNPFARLLCRPLAISEMGARELRALATGTKSELWKTTVDEETGAAQISHDWMGNPVPTPFDLGDTRVIPMFGPMTRGFGIMGQYYGMCDTDKIRDQIIEAANDPAVRRIVMHVRSPGGDAQLCEETARALFAARDNKDTMTFCDEIMASAAYYVGCASEVIYCTASAMAGNIGSYIVLCDDSKFWADNGFKWIVARSGEFKGAGIDGFTENQLAEIQGWADAFGAQFRRFVADARKDADGNSMADENMQGQLFIDNDLTLSLTCDFFASDMKDALAQHQAFKSIGAQP